MTKVYRVDNGLVHPDEHRKLGTREAARLQSFPDEYVWGEGRCQQVHARIGNSVPPLMMRAIATTVRQTLDTTRQPEGAHHG